MAVGVKTIILDEGEERVLLIQRRDVGIWQFPGGGIDEGESLQEAAAREAKEETGLGVKVGKLFGVYLITAPGIRATTICFRARKMNGEEETSLETKNLGWFSVSEAKKIIQPHDSQRLSDCLSDPKRIVFRKQRLRFTLGLFFKYLFMVKLGLRRIQNLVYQVRN